MSKSTPVGGFLRNAVAVFEDPQSLGLAVSALNGKGIDLSRLSLIAPQRQASSTFALFRSGMESGILVPEMAGAGAAPAGWTRLGPNGSEGLASAGLLADDLHRLVLEAQGDMGVALASWLPRSAAQFIARQLEAGKLVLWVHLRDALEERHVCSLLLDHSRNTVQVHDLRIDGHA